MIKVTCPPATAVNQLNTSYIIDILVITFPMAHSCKIYLTLILSIQRWAHFSRWMVKVVLNVALNFTGITITSSLIPKSAFYLTWHMNRLVVPSHLLNRHPCVLHFHPGWSDLSSRGSRKEKNNTKFKVTSVVTCFYVLYIFWDLCMKGCKLLTCVNSKNMEDVFLQPYPHTAFFQALCLTQRPDIVSLTCLESSWRVRVPELELLCLHTTVTH